MGLWICPGSFSSRFQVTRDSRLFNCLVLSSCALLRLLGAGCRVGAEERLAFQPAGSTAGLTGGLICEDKALKGRL